MTTYENSLHLLMAHCAANTNLCAAAVKLIDLAPENERSNLFVRFLYEFRFTPTDKSSKVHEVFSTEPDLEVINSVKVIEKFVEAHEDAHLSEDEYHEKLWNLICETAKDDVRRKAILIRACTLIRKLPYINKDNAMTMEAEEFKSEGDKIDPIYGARIRHIGKQDLSQVTEDASLFLPIIESGRNEREKVVLLSWVLITFGEKFMSGLKNFLNDNDD